MKESGQRMDDPVRIGVVGCGSVLRRPYMNILRSMAHDGLIEITAVCDNDEDKLRAASEAWSAARATPDYHEVVGSDDVDVVMVLTSMPLHGPISREALEHGKHVFVEKPMATTLEEAAELIELAKRQPGHLVCAPAVTLSPTFEEIGGRIQRGDIGPVLAARGRYGWAGPTWGKWYYQTGGGPLFDLGVYNVTSLTGWLGPAQRVTAMAETAVPERVVDGESITVKVEDNVHLVLDFGGGTLATVTTGFTMPKYRSPALELYGADGTLQMLGDDWAPQGYELWSNRLGSWQVFDDTAPNWPWTSGIRHLVECIQSGETPTMAPEHAYHVLEIMVRALESAREGKAKTLTTTFEPLQFDAPQRGAEHLVHDRSHR
jgi:predicted dehydrogenase